jgi:hypothetical protein
MKRHSNDSGFGILAETTKRRETMRIKPTLIQFALVALCVGAHTSQSIASPTDIELKAAYCLAVKKHEVDITNEALSNLESMHADTGTARKGLAETNDQLERLRAYILPKTMGDDSTALAVALARGQRDIARLESPDVTQCSSKCGVPHADSAANMAKFDACVVSCAPELIPGIRSCNDLSWLPF